MKLFALSLFLSACLHAADLSGIWTGQTTSRFGDIEDVFFKFSQSGPALTGKVYGDKESTPIGDGKVEGDQISFTITVELNGGPRVTRYAGKIVGNELQLERKRIPRAGDPPPQNPNQQNQLTPQTLTLKRVL